MQAIAREDEVLARRLPCRHPLAGDATGTQPGLKTWRKLLAVPVELRRLAVDRGVRPRSQAVGIDDKGDAGEPPSQGDRLGPGQPKMPGIHYTGPEPNAGASRRHLFPGQPIGASQSVLHAVRSWVDRMPTSLANPSPPCTYADRCRKCRPKLQATSSRLRRSTKGLLIGTVAASTSKLMQASP